MLLVAYLAILRTISVGMASYHGADFSPEHIVRLIQSFSRVFEHSVSYPAKVIEILSGKHLTGSAALRALIQD